jgi:hypothetical protein
VLQVRVLDAQAGALTVEEPCEPPSVASDREATIELLWRRQAFSKACPGCAFYFALEKAREDGETSPYVTSYTVLSDGKSFAVLYRVAPDVENRILWLVGKGALPGHLMSNSPDSPVVLGPLSSKHYELMLSVETGLFDWHQPTVFVKLPDDLDPCKKPARSR